MKEDKTVLEKLSENEDIAILKIILMVFILFFIFLNAVGCFEMVDPWDIGYYIESILPMYGGGLDIGKAFIDVVSRLNMILGVIQIIFLLVKKDNFSVISYISSIISVFTMIGFEPLIDKCMFGDDMVLLDNAGCELTTIGRIVVVIAILNFLIQTIFAFYYYKRKNKSL